MKSILATKVTKPELVRFIRDLASHNDTGLDTVVTRLLEKALMLEDTQRELFLYWYSNMETLNLTERKIEALARFLPGTQKVVQQRRVTVRRGMGVLNGEEMGE